MHMKDDDLCKKADNKQPGICHFKSVVKTGMVWGNFLEMSHLALTK